MGSPSLQHDAYNDHATSRLEQMKRDLALMREQLASLCRASTAITDPRNGAAQRVFSITELVEQILFQLDPASLMKAAQINQLSAATISESRMLRRKLCLVSEADSNAHYTSPLANSSFPCIQYIEHKDGLHKTKEHALKIEVRFNAEKCGIPRVGSVGRAMLVCQPPVHEAAVEVSCCGLAHITVYYGLPRPEKIKPVHSATGLTIGDLLDRAAGLQEQHRECVYAEWHQLDDDGFVRPRVTFRCTVALTEEDPVFDVRRRFEAAEHEKKAKADVARKRLQLVVDARRRAFLRELERGNSVDGLAGSG